MNKKKAVAKTVAKAEDKLAQTRKHPAYKAITRKVSKKQIDSVISPIKEVKAGALVVQNRALLAPEPEKTAVAFTDTELVMLNCGMCLLDSHMKGDKGKVSILDSIAKAFPPDKQQEEHDLHRKLHDITDEIDKKSGLTAKINANMSPQMQAMLKDLFKDIIKGINEQ